MSDFIPYEYRDQMKKLGLWDRVVFRKKLLWFPIRRNLRRAKRCFIETKNWLIFFIPFAIAFALGIVICLACGAIELIELGSLILSVIFGSFALLMMKDIWDKEKRRHEILAEQFEIYEQYLGFIQRKYSELLDLGNVILSFHARYPFENEAFSNLFVQEATKQKVTFSNMPQRNKVIEELIDEFVQFRGVLSYKHFIDFRSSNLFLNIHYTIEHLNSIKTLSQPTSPTYADNIVGILLSSYHIFACLRRPWRYPMDSHKRRQLEIWLENHTQRDQLATL